MSAVAAQKAAVLAEALPWLERFQGSTVVVKYGGHAMVDEGLKRAFAEDVVFLRLAGLRPVVVHGGGPQIDAMLGRLGVESTFVDGLRVTTPEAMDVVRMVLTGQVQREVVGLVNRHGRLAVGMSGEDAHLFTAAPRDPRLGLVGDVVRVDATFVETVLDDGLVPVVSSVAVGDDGAVYNVNADSAAAALAVGLKADKLVVLTDVAGLLTGWSAADPTSGTVVGEISVSQLRDLLPSLSAGMAPKMAACLNAVDSGVAKAHVLDGRLPHALLLEVFTDSGVGTQVVP
jgi:acetylglutamate kinase